MKQVWIQSFFLFYTDYLIKAEEHSLPYYLHIAMGRTDKFMPNLKALVESETQPQTSTI